MHSTSLIRSLLLLAILGKPLTPEAPDARPLGIKFPISFLSVAWNQISYQLTPGRLESNFLSVTPGRLESNFLSVSKPLTPEAPDARPLGIKFPISEPQEWQVNQ